MIGVGKLHISHLVYDVHTLKAVESQINTNKLPMDGWVGGWVDG
jgi:hypothetical protein